MSSTVLKKVKKAPTTKTKHVAEIDPAPAPSLKAHKSKLAKPEQHIQKTKSKLVKGKETKRDAQPLLKTAQRARDNTMPATVKRDNPTTRLSRKPRGPWKAPSPSPSPSPPSDVEFSHSEKDEPEGAQEEEEEEEEGGSGDENVHLYGFSTDEDSSDDDLDVDEGADLNVGSLPTVARDDVTIKRKLEKAKRKPVRVHLLAIFLPRLMAHYGRRSSGVRNGRSLSRPDPAWILRGSVACIFLPIRRDIASPPLAE